jgi:hypothetical protein
MFRCAIVSLFGICLLGVVSPGFSQTTLAAKFQKGDVEKLRKTFTRKQVFVSGERNDPFTLLEETIDMDVICDDVDDQGTAALRQRIVRVKVFGKELQSPTGKVMEFQYDSTIPPGDNPLLSKIDKSIRPMIGSEWLMKCDPQGQVSDISIPPQVLDGIKEGGFAGKLFYEEGLHRIAEETGFHFPKSPVKPGDEWKSSVASDSPLGKLVEQRTFEVGEPGKKPEVTEINVRIGLTIEPNPNSKLPVQVKLLDGDGEGKILFDQAAGKLLETRLTQKMTMEFKSTVTQKRIITSELVVAPIVEK